MLSWAGGQISGLSFESECQEQTREKDAGADGCMIAESPVGLAHYRKDSGGCWIHLFLTAFWSTIFTLKRWTHKGFRPSKNGSGSIAGGLD